MSRVVCEKDEAPESRDTGVFDFGGLRRVHRGRDGLDEDVVDPDQAADGFLSCAVLDLLLGYLERRVALERFAHGWPTAIERPATGAVVLPEGEFVPLALDGELHASRTVRMELRIDLVPILASDGDAEDILGLAGDLDLQMVPCGQASSLHHQGIELTDGVAEFGKAFHGREEVVHDCLGARRNRKGRTPLC